MKSNKEICKKIFALKNVNLTHENSLEFYQSQWQQGNKISLIYVTYRILLALIFTITLIISIIDLNNITKSAVLRAKWMIYLTNWHFSIATLQAILSACMVTYMFLFIRKNGEFMQLNAVNEKLCGIYWALHTIAINGAIFVTIVYWTMVYDEKKDTLSMVNLFTHAINAIILLIDLFIIAHSVQIMHFYLPVAFNLIYVFFSVIYYYLGGTDKYDLPYIYNILNWDKPTKTIIYIMGICIFVIILHIITCFCVVLRKRIAMAFQKRETLDNVLIPLNYTNKTTEK